MRSEWREISIADVADLTVGFVGTMTNEYKDSGIKFIRSMNVHPFRISFSDIKYISEDFHSKISKSQLHANDVVIVRTGQPGASAVIPEGIGQLNCSDLVIIHPDLEKIDPMFLCAYINLSSGVISSNLVGAVQQHFNVGAAKKMKIMIPDIIIQKRIGNIIKTINERIETNEKINDNLYQMVSARYTFLFGSDMKQKTTIGQYSTRIFSGGTPSTTKPEFWDGVFHWFSSGETSNRFAITTEKTITQEGVDNSSTKLAHKYDIVMASAGQGLTRGQTTMLLLDTYVNQSVIVIHADRLYLPYLFWNLVSRYEELRAISDSNSIRGSLTTKMIAGFDIPEVNTQTLHEFSDFAWSIIPEIEKNLVENERLTALRDALLPKLISGEIDVTNTAI